MINVMNMIKQCQIVTNILIAFVITTFFMVPVGAYAQECAYMHISSTDDLHTNPLEIAKLQVFLKDLQRYDLEVTGVYNATTDEFIRDVLLAYGVTDIDPLSDDAQLAGVVNAIVCGTLQPVVLQSDAQESSAAIDDIDEVRRDTSSEADETVSTSSATSAPPTYSTVDGEQLKGTPVGFVNEYSLPILIMLFLVVSVQIVYMWGIAPRRRMQLIPREFK